MQLHDYELNEVKLRSAVELGIQRAGKAAPPRRALALAIAVVLLLSATALAATLLRGNVDWDGHHQPDEPRPEPTAASPEEERGWALAEKAGLLLESAPDNELWVCMMPDGSAQHKSVIETFSDLSDVQARITEAGLRLPGYVPDGFALESCEISFYFTPDVIDEAESYEQTEVDSDMMLRKYRFGANLHENIQGYSLHYASADKRWIIIEVNLDSSDTSMSFGLDGAEAYKTVDIPGMAKALYVQNPDAGNVLYAKQEGLAARAYIPETMLWMDGDADLEVYDEAVYFLHTNALGEQEMLKIARGLH